nr:itaconate transport protein [Quercus suber]
MDSRRASSTSSISESSENSIEKDSPFGRSAESLHKAHDDKDAKDRSLCETIPEVPQVPAGASLSRPIVIADEKAVNTLSEPSSAQEEPYHIFSSRMKGFLVFMVSLVAALSGLSSNIFFPAQPAIAEDLQITPQIVNLSITTYIIAQGIGPSFWAVLADRTGRRTTLIYTLLLYVGANVALALAVNGPMLLAFRALQALGSSSTIALGAGVIADIAPASRRGSYLGWFSGRKSHKGAAGWRSIFWFLVAFSGLSVVLLLLFLPETLRRIAGDGSTPLSSWRYRPLLWSLMQYNKNADEEATCSKSHAEIKDPAKLTWMTFVEPITYLGQRDVACALAFGACVYTAWSMMVATTSYTLEAAYGFTTIEVGLCFLANGLGCVAGSILAGRSLNHDFAVEVKLWQHERRQGPEENFPAKKIPTSFPLEKARLSKGRMYSVAAIFSFIVYGWSLTAQHSRPEDGRYRLSDAHWIVPLLAQFVNGWSATSVLISNNALIVDLYPGKGASVTAIMNLTRCLTAAGGIAGVQPFLERFGPGWTSVLLAGICALGFVPYCLHCKHGAKWRDAREQVRVKASDE